MQGTADSIDPLALAVLAATREQLRAALLVLSALPGAHRNDVRAGVVQALGACEDVLGLERTYPRREERRQERDLSRPS